MDSSVWSDKIRHFCQFKRSHEEGYRFLAAPITADDFVSAVLVSPVDDQVTLLQIYLIFGVSIAFLSQTENVSKNRWMETHLQSNKFLLALTHTSGEWTTDALFGSQAVDRLLFTSPRLLTQESLLQPFSPREFITNVKTGSQHLWVFI